MKYLSLFSGIGGFELGIKQAYEIHNADRSKDRGSQKNSDGDERQRLQSEERKEVDSEKGSVSECNNNITNEGPLCIGFSEIDKYATSIYQKHFPNHKNYGDITKINEATLPDFDLLVGGFPCQSFSIAGKRRGFDDTRGTLFFEIARIIKQKQPRLLLLENVKGLLSHDKGNTFTTIISTLDELGYDIQWQVLNSKNHGVPQNRERVFIIGHFRGTSRPEVFPFGEESEEDTRRTGEDLSYCLDANYAKGTNTTLKGRRQIVKVSGDLDKRKTYLGDIASTLAANPTSDNTARLYEDSKIRRLTPTECERLQGFEDSWTEYGIDKNGNQTEISDTQRYKCCGNAVTVNVIRDIISSMI